MNLRMYRFVFWVALLLHVLGSARPARAQAAFQTLLTNGPSSNRLNMTLLSEGYTASQLPKFLFDATNAVNALLAAPPYSEYSNYFNAFAIQVASLQSGSSHPNSGIQVDTYFGSSFDPFSDKLITIPPFTYDTNYAHGQGRVDSLLQTYMPGTGLPILLVNDLIAGGSDGFYQTAIASTAAGAYDNLRHETGHVLANLGDEYTLDYPGFPNTEEPNTTQETRPGFIKWKAWIDTNATPVPTPATAPYWGVVGLFQGAHYHTTNWYRPQQDCAMRSPSVAFCSVCSEALVKAIYAKVRPVDSATPVATNFTVTTAQAVPFNLTLLHPATHSLSVQWSLDGVRQTGASNSFFSVSPIALSNGTHTVSVSVKDLTSLVRNDPSNLLSQTLSWSFKLSGSRLAIDSTMSVAGGKFAFHISGSATNAVIVQSSSNLSSWTPLRTNSFPVGGFWYTNTVGAGGAALFYRAATTP